MRTEEVPKLDLESHRTPEWKMGLMWNEIGEKAKGLKDWITSRGWKIAGILNGGDLYKAEGVQIKEDQKVLYSDRPFAVVVTDDGKVVHWPTEKMTTDERNEKRLDANLAAYREVYADFLETQDSIKKLGYNPIPKASQVIEVDGKYVTVVDFANGLHSLGQGSPAEGIHEFNTRFLSPRDMEGLVRAIDAAHVSSKEFYARVDQSRIPDRSWFKEGFKICFRGKEWWFNKTKRKENATQGKQVGNEEQEYGDRLGELYEKVRGSAEMSRLVHEVAPELDFRKALEGMIVNNQFLYPPQKAQIAELNDMMVVVHGTICPDNIQAFLGKDGKMRYLLSSGDRSQGVGLRGQEIDWLVSACAASPEHQYALINAFIKIQAENHRNVELEKRGLAMHILYRAISEGRWFADKGKTKEAENLVRLSRDILEGNGVWRGVNRALVVHEDNR